MGISFSMNALTFAEIRKYCKSKRKNNSKSGVLDSDYEETLLNTNVSDSETIGDSGLFRKKLKKIEYI